MKKIVSLFQRNYDGDRLVRDEVVSGAEWVIAGEGVSTRKYDGTCCMIQGGKLFKRYDVKTGKTAPDGFIPAQDPDPITGHWPGWLLCTTSPEDIHHMSAHNPNLPDGTYELCGPKTQGNPEHFECQVLVPHGKEILDAPRTFSELREWFKGKDIEGIVWHHPDGRMVKIKKKDFGLKREE